MTSSGSSCSSDDAAAVFSNATQKRGKMVDNKVYMHACGNMSVSYALVFLLYFLRIPAVASRLDDPEADQYVTRHTSHLTRHTSHLTRHTSYVTRNTSHVTRHTSHVTPHTSHVTRNTSHLTLHTSHLTPHTSHLAPHTSHLTPHTSHLKPHTSHETPHTSHPNTPTPVVLPPLPPPSRRVVPAPLLRVVGRAIASSATGSGHVPKAV